MRREALAHSSPLGWMRTLIIFPIALTCGALSGCSGEAGDAPEETTPGQAGGLHTFEAPEAHTDVGNDLTLTRTDAGCVEAALEGGRVLPPAFPGGTTVEEDGVTLPDGESIAFDEPTMVGGATMEWPRAEEDMALVIDADCAKGDTYMLVW